MTLLKIRSPWAVLIFALSILCVYSLPALSQDDEAEADAESEEVVARPEALYIPLLPPFVVNYGGSGRLRYLKAEMTVRVHDTDSAQAVRHHMPAIRDRIVMLLSAQEELVIDTQEGKELLRQDALTAVRDVIAEEEGKKREIVDLFFDNLIVQR